MGCLNARFSRLTAVIGPRSSVIAHVAVFLSLRDAFAQGLGIPPILGAIDVIAPISTLMLQHHPDRPRGDI